jgi:hypothetical protein
MKVHNTQELQNGINDTLLVEGQAFNKKYGK